MSTWIVTPTYNERDNLQPFLTDLFALSPVEVVVVDDNSPDGTGQLAEDLRATYDHLHVIHRPGKAGLGSAYQEGFRYALGHGADRIVQLDADRSHDPKVIPALLSALEKHDLAIASRYVPGGSMPIVWYRRWISSLGNLYIRALLGWEIHDWSTGFKAWRSDLLRRVMAQPMSGQGYGWLMETTWLARQSGGRLAEVPLVFADRQAGQSKFSWAIVVEEIRLAWNLSHRSS